MRINPYNGKQIDIKSTVSKSGAYAHTKSVGVRILAALGLFFQKAEYLREENGETRTVTYYFSKKSLAKWRDTQKSIVLRDESKDNPEKRLRTWVQKGWKGRIHYSYFVALPRKEYLGLKGGAYALTDQLSSTRKTWDEAYPHG